MARPGGQSAEEDLCCVQDTGADGAGPVLDCLLHLLADEHHSGGLHTRHPSARGAAHTAGVCLCQLPSKQAQDLF